MNFDTLLMTRRDRTLTITLNRPDRLNAFDAQMHTELPHAISLATHDAESDLIILTGAGRAFSAGGDLDWQEDAARRPFMFEQTVREAKQIVYGMIDCEKPIIAKINGPAVGLGATIAVLSDISFIADDTYIADPHVNIGMVAGDGAALIWPQLIGFARAKEYLFTGDRIGAAEAARIGLVNHAVARTELDASVDAFADRLAKAPQQALRYTKMTINVALRAMAGAVMDVGLGYESVTNMSADHLEALRAFREKRKPTFQTQKE
ncbi:enoyl-CoA hydratase-related protein [Sphingobium subterraneum]|uniref:Enoyl-CoA hydratase n=1 Tax=Sphingobium subterraneum TaxID=627688 RepID=A0A841J4P5_9SPHN|nr:enoyl-CoA hydratase-related protein [Sphingobium subterraneum]MBB6125312.1 enoyl-CoA hydratase [Sphingobium subterraneum]